MRSRKPTQTSHAWAIAIGAHRTLVIIGIFLVPNNAYSRTYPMGQDPSSTTTVSPPDTIEGTFQGTLHRARDLRMVIKVERDQGILSVTLYRLDQGGGPHKASAPSFSRGSLKFALPEFGGRYEGNLSSDRRFLIGTWEQDGIARQLNLERATPQTEWTLPAETPSVSPMTTDHDPSFDVASIKPSPSNEGTYEFRSRGHVLQILHVTAMQLVGVAYGMTEQQLLNAPGWMQKQRFDIVAEPDVPGEPDDHQVAFMIQKLLAARFQLQFERQQREMSAYLLTGESPGSGMIRSSTGSSNLSSFRFGRIGNLHVSHANMTDFTDFLQTVLLDRPVLNRTGIEGRWDFALRWTPDASQLAAMGITARRPSEEFDDPAPDLAAAIKQQLGLRLELRKTQVPVLAVTHIEEPSPN